LAEAYKSEVAYFSMEIGLEPSMPTYSGGLGILAGDTLRAAADASIPLVGVTLLYRKGYFRQHLDALGNQTESSSDWKPEEFLQLMPYKVPVSIVGRKVMVRSWSYMVTGVSGFKLPVYFLDTDLPENSPWDRTITDCLYGGDLHYRLCQEIVLGLGGIYLLNLLGHKNIHAYHMNEGHPALLALALLEEHTAGERSNLLSPADIEPVRELCVYTTHTPVPAAIDQFPIEMARVVLGEEHVNNLKMTGCLKDGTLNMTYLGLHCSRYINGVSMRHEEISQSMFPNYPINSITNGVHAYSWVSPSFRQLYDRHIPEWRKDNPYLRYSISIPVEEIYDAHTLAKKELVLEVEKRTGIKLSESVMTIGFARRATPYKRANLLFSDMDRLRHIAQHAGPLQIIYAGKAHPQDGMGKGVIRSVFKSAAELREVIRIIYLEEYDIDLARHMCAGVDLWLNTPQKPEEASGTSGMKAALNGVPSLSVLDGWWIEGHVEGVTGWSIGDSYQLESNPEAEIASLYNKLEYIIIPLYYNRPLVFAEVMRYAIALNGSYYNAQRMLSQYMKNAYLFTQKYE
jgi:glycogen phosphorylase